MPFARHPTANLRLRNPVRLSWRAAGVALFLGACALPAPERPQTFTFRVPPGQTFDLTRGQMLPRERLASRLTGVRLFFLGENHTEPGSHGFQREVLEELVRAGRRVTVALEMFPPAADEALDGWRQGHLEELPFLEQADWYTHWGFPWDTYREVFEVIRAHRLPVHGVNASRKTRAAARRGDLSELSLALRAEIGDLDDAPLAHRDYLFDTLHQAGHGGDLAPDSPGFKAFHRVQTLWDRLMGTRAARLIDPADPQAIVVVLIGSGHVAFKLGANLQAARAGAAAQLSLWDGVAGHDDLDAAGRALVPVGIADLARVYLAHPARPTLPSLTGVGLEKNPEGVRVSRVSRIAPGPARRLRVDDIVLAVGGQPVRSLTALRLAYERTPPEQPPVLKVLRGGKPLTLGEATQKTPR